MSDTLPQWQIAVREQFDAEQAAQYIEGIDGMLQDDSCEVLRQMISEMMLNMREVRMFPMRIQQEADAQVKAAALCQMEIDGEMRTLTIDDFAQVLLDRIAEGRQMLDVMMFYVMALSEQKADEN
jgi:hypothetical protein